MPHVVGFAKNSSLRNRAALARACANMCRHVLRASVEPHPITPGEREGGVQEKNTHTNVRRFRLQKQQKIEGWNQQQRRKQESQNQHVWKIGTHMKSFQAQSNVVLNTSRRWNPIPSSVNVPTNKPTYGLSQLNYSRNRETSLKNALPNLKSQQKQLIAENGRRTLATVYRRNSRWSHHHQAHQALELRSLLLLIDLGVIPLPNTRIERQRRGRVLYA
jgi:hypothetical protein